MMTLLALSLLVILHELGHYLAAKLFGVRVEEFGIGIPPKALTLFRYRGTEYTLNWLPLGGFVRLYGEQGELTALENLNPVSRQQAFCHKPAWQRGIILASGIASNLFVGAIIFGVIYTVVGIPRETGRQVMIAGVSPNSPAQLAGIKPMQVVERIGEQSVVSADNFVELIGAKKGEQVNLYLRTMQSDGTLSDESAVVVVMPRVAPPPGEGALGVAVNEVPILIYEKKPWYTAPFYGLVEGVKEGYLWSKEIALGLIDLGQRLVQGEVPQGLSGPVGVVRAGGEAQQAGWVVYGRFIALISLNLAIFNLLPLPALDGGRILFLFLEKLLGKGRTAKIEPLIHGVGFLLLIGLLVVVTVMDLT